MSNDIFGNMQLIGKEVLDDKAALFTMTRIAITICGLASMSAV